MDYAHCRLLLFILHESFCSINCTYRSYSFDGDREKNRNNVGKLFTPRSGHFISSTRFLIIDWKLRKTSKATLRGWLFLLDQSSCSVYPFHQQAVSSPARHISIVLWMNCSNPVSSIFIDFLTRMQPFP